MVNYRFSMIKVRLLEPARLGQEKGRKMKKIRLSTFLAVVVLLSPLVLPAGLLAITDSPDARLETQVRHQLVTLPFYGVFDSLSYRVDGGTVTLSGDVTRPSLRRDAERAVSRIAGVDEVVNQIEVLPLSNHDDWLRLELARAIFRQPGLEKYAAGAQPSIRVIVSNGHVRLEGEVVNSIDSRLAYVRAGEVFGVFSVTNNLRVVNDRS
jgi:hyperosmotically inducible protein